ncbi:hypothetical protein [uncultured Litoreibacter sp.]|uniref:hypothetical protein n=1 Tax=uncultured Litoreibacter sp. TaxID=1392394 RepID=UPI002638EE6A|nr:hypothetical protein [uncultured Litoreibacter sp.]
MNFLSDILLGFGAIAAAIYCFVLSRKLSNLKGLDQDLGSAIAVLSGQVDEMTKALASAQNTASDSAQQLEARTAAATQVSERLELMIAALQDLSETDDDPIPDEQPQPTNEVLFVRNASRQAS